MTQNPPATCPPDIIEARQASTRAGGCPVSPLGYEAPPLRPDSVTWRYFGDWRRYHALNPDVFYWAHATFFVGTIHVAGAGVVGGIPGLLGSHVPQRMRKQPEVG